MQLFNKAPYSAGSMPPPAAGSTVGPPILSPFLNQNTTHSLPVSKAILKDSIISPLPVPSERLNILA